MNAIDPVVDLPSVWVNGTSSLDCFAELVERQRVDRSKDRTRKSPGRRRFQRPVLSCAEAGIDGHHDRQRKRRLAIEYRDLLCLAVFLELEVSFFRPETGAP